MRRRALAAAAAMVLLAACSPAAPKRRTVEERTVTDDARRIVYVADENWISSPAIAQLNCILDGSFFSFRVYSLIQAKKEFVDNLPDSLYPQIDGWARHDYLIKDPRTLAADTVGGLPAARLDYAWRERPDDPPGSLVFWVVRHKAYLYVFRAAFRPNRRAESLDEVRSMLSSVKFLEPPEDPDGTPPAPGS